MVVIVTVLVLIWMPIWAALMLSDRAQLRIGLFLLHLWRDRRLV
jgi:hypothetical protein